METIDILRTFLEQDSPETHCFSELAALPTGAEYIPLANIATHLVPRAEKNFQDKPTMDVVGNDGPGLSTPGYPWPDDLKRWLAERNCTTRYLLLNPAPESLNSLKKLKKQKGGERLSVFVLKKGIELNGEWADIIKQWETYHFAIFDNPRQMWIETKHEPRTTDARGCYFLSPELSHESGVYDVLRERFEYVVNHYTDSL